MKKAILALPSCECADLRSSTFSPEPPPLADQSGSPPAVVGAPVQPPVPAVKQGRFRFLFAATGVVGLLVVLVAGWMLQPRPEESTVAAARRPVAPASTLSEPSFSARADAVSTDATPIPASLAETNDARDSSEPATAPRDAGTAHSDTNTAVVAVPPAEPSADAAVPDDTLVDEIKTTLHQLTEQKAVSEEDMLLTSMESTNNLDINRGAKSSAEVEAGRLLAAFEPAQAFLPNVEVCADAECRPQRNYGTVVNWAESVSDAALEAFEADKLLFVMHVSGNFADPGFT